MEKTNKNLQAGRQASKRKLTIFGCIITAVILIGVAVITACAVNLKHSDAAGEGNFVSVGEIYENCNNVQKLYDLIGGAKNTSFLTITQMANTTTNAATIRAKTYNKTNTQDIKVTFGGKVWDVVYLSTTQDNRPILTLWLHDSLTSCQWNSYSTSYYQGGNTSNLNTTYPAAVYGTSYIRALINNGGQHGVGSANQSATNTLVNYTPVANYALQEFLSGGNYADLIVTPTVVGWQESSQKNFVVSYDAPNDAWGPGFSGPNNKTGSPNYAIWQYDNLWLPSLPEVGDSSSATTIFGISDSVRGSCWVRSAYHAPGSSSDRVRCAGSTSTMSPTETHGVRPALHLDLSALNATRTAEHNYGEWQTTTAAGCTNDGEREHTCQNCGHIESEVVTALGHEYTHSFDQESGFTTFTCFRCQDSYQKACTDTVNGHHFSEMVTAPACESRGYTTYHCETCGHTYQSHYTLPTGHAFGEWKIIKEPSVDATGVQQRVCEHCGAEETRNVAPLAGTTSNGNGGNNAPLRWGIIIGVIAVLAGCGGLAWLLLAVFKPKRAKSAAAA